MHRLTTFSFVQAAQMACFSQSRLFVHDLSGKHAAYQRWRTWWRGAVTPSSRLREWGGLLIQRLARVSACERVEDSIQNQTSHVSRKRMNDQADILAKGRPIGSENGSLAWLLRHATLA
ncbi:hypothetical protein MRB53_038900 [Persea americana]|nr:hypothetical protein MRB53_038900 [Persea americana]